MAVSYLGINISSLTYLAVLLFGLIIFVIILIVTEKQRQRRHHRELKHKINQKIHHIEEHKKSA
jgi:hypothetical protein